MIELLNMKNTEVLEQVLDLQVKSYKIEAEIIEYYDLPPLNDTLESLSSCGETFYGFIIEGAIAGIISYKKADEVVDIHRMAIHPKFFRRGIASKLLEFVESVEGDYSRIIVCTGQDNIPAQNLYLKRGFKKVRDIKISANLTLTEFEKTEV